MSDAATAFVPGHATVFFAPRRHDDPSRTGSIGAGITTADGVTVRVEPADERAIVLDGEPIAMEPVDRVLDALDVAARIEAETPLAVGTGFGVSGAMALGTALAANRVADGARTENELIAIAHRAEVESGTGLGDVVAQARGGLPVRLEPGAPGHGVLDGIPDAGRVEYLTFGEISTGEVIGGDTAGIETAGEAALSDLRERPTLDRLFALGRRFARDADLPTPRLEGIIEDVREAGGEATMVMLGESVIAPGAGLSDAGYDPAVSRIHPAGAALQPG